MIFRLFFPFCIVISCIFFFFEDGNSIICKISYGNIVATNHTIYSCRYDEIESKMVPFLKSSGYNVKKGEGLFTRGLLLCLMSRYFDVSK